MCIYIYIYDSRWLAHFRCRFIEGVWSRATFLNGFLLFGVWFWRCVCVIYRFGQLWLSKCVSGEGLVRSRWLAPVRGVLRHPSLSIYKKIVNSR